MQFNAGPQIGEFPNNPELTQAWNWFSVEHLPPPFGHFTNLTKFVPSLVLSTRSVFCPHLDSFLQFAHSLQNINSFVRGWANGCCGMGAHVSEAKNFYKTLGRNLFLSYPTFLICKAVLSYLASISSNKLHCTTMQLQAAMRMFKKCIKNHMSLL